MSKLWYLLFLYFYCVQGCYVPKPVKGKAKILSLNWNTYPNGPYRQRNATCDLGPTIGWKEPQAAIINGTLRMTILPNKVADGGLMTRALVPPGQEYAMKWSFKFDKNFHWGHGGKLGFGFVVGKGHTGCDPAWPGDGGSFRIMWKSRELRDNSTGMINTDNSNPYLIPYIYHKDQPTECGDNFGKKFFNLQKDTWYQVYMYIKSNTGLKKNGKVKVLINNQTLIDTTIRWTTKSSERLIKAIHFNTFRGGKQWYWTTPTSDYIYYDNLVVTKLS